MTKPTPNPNTNKLLSLLVFLFIAAVVTIIVLAAANRHMLARYNEDQQSIKKELKKNKQLHDSLKTAETRLHNLTEYWSQAWEHQQKAVMPAQFKKVDQNQTVYEKVFVTLPPPWDRDQLDSLQDRILTRGFRRP